MNLLIELRSFYGDKLNSHQNNNNTNSKKKLKYIFEESKKDFQYPYKNLCIEKVNGNNVHKWKAKKEHETYVFW